MYGGQLKWLEAHLNRSDAEWHILLCHAPLLAHNPKRSDTKPYLSRDEQLQKNMDANENILFISSHTHISMESGGCVEHDGARNNIYINDGSIHPTTVLKEDGKVETESGDGNLVELEFREGQITITGVSLCTGQNLLCLSV